ncbi:MAG: hypothetical protein WCL50_09685 [Spirochaetota bacterium]
MWDFFEPRERTWYRWNLNGAEVWLHKSGDEWRAGVKPIRYRDITSEAAGPQVVKSAPDMPLLIAVAHSAKVALRPVMPGEPFLIMARNEVSILGGQETRFLIDLPIFLRLEMDTGEFIGEWRPFTLSNTWFGDKIDGTLCLSIPAALDPICRDEDMDASLNRPSFRSLIRCEILLKNDTKTQLDLKLLAVYAELLPVYAAGDFLATDRIQVDGLPDGGLKSSVVRIGAHHGSWLLSTARVKQSELLVRRGVNFLRTIAGW